MRKPTITEHYLAIYATEYAIFLYLRIPRRIPSYSSNLVGSHILIQNYVPKFTLISFSFSFTEFLRKISRVMGNKYV